MLRRKNSKLRNSIMFPVILFFLTFFVFTPKSHAIEKQVSKGKKDGCKVIILPLDARNQTYDYIGDIVRIHGYDPVIPPRFIMGNISKYEDAYKKQMNIWYWLNHKLDNNCGILIMSVDSLVYGGLLESRHSPIDTQRALNNVKLIEIIKKRHPGIKILAFASIPRKEAENRERNFAVNMKLLNLVENGTIDFLSISGDDVTDISKQVNEIAALKKEIRKKEVGDRVLISDVDRIRLGIDESAMVIFTRFINKRCKEIPKIYIEYRDITAARTEIDYYSATPVMSVAIDMVEAAGAKMVYNPDDADLVLAVNHASHKITSNNFIERIIQLMRKKPVSVGDLSNRNQKAEFFRKFYETGYYPALAGYATWGMGTNTLGTSVCMGCAYLSVKKLQQYKYFLAFLYERMLTDCIYLNNIHLKLAKETKIPAYSTERMTPGQQMTAVDMTVDGLVRNLEDLNVKCKVIKTKNQAFTKPENEEIDYIPLSSQEKSENSSTIKFIEFSVEIPPAAKAAGVSKVEVSAGPVTFPFHRLFEINIPVSVEFIDKTNREN